MRPFLRNFSGRPRPSRPAILPLCLLVVLPACARKDPPPPGPPEKVTLAAPLLPIPSLFHVAHARGYFPAEGLEVTPQPFEYGKLALQSLLDGKADLAISADTPVMFAVASGRRVAVIAVIGTSTKGSAIVARRDRGIAAPSDLAGKRVGLARGTTADFFLASFLETRGIGREKVTLVDMKPKDLPGAVASGEVDAVSAFQPALENSVQALGENGVAFFDDTVYSDIFCLSTTPEFADRRPEAVRRVLRALLRAETFVREDQAESRRLVARAISMDPAFLEKLWGTMAFRVTLDQALLVSLEDQARWAVNAGLVPGKPKPDFLEVVHPEILRSVRPEAVAIYR